MLNSPYSALTPVLLCALLLVPGAQSHSHQDVQNTNAASGDTTVSVEKQLRDKVSYWARAWTEQRAEDYFNFYSEIYAGNGFANRRAWIENRRIRIEGPEYIRIRLYDFQLLESSDSQATVRFMLIYERPGYCDRTLKEMDWVNQSGDWSITEETNVLVDVMSPTGC